MSVEENPKEDSEEEKPELKEETKTKKISFEYHKNNSQAELEPTNEDDVNYMATYAIIITVGGRKFTYRRSRID